MSLEMLKKRRDSLTEHQRELQAEQCKARQAAVGGDKTAIGELPRIRVEIAQTKETLAELDGLIATEESAQEACEIRETQQQALRAASSELSDYVATWQRVIAACEAFKTAHAEHLEVIQRLRYGIYSAVPDLRARQSFDLAGSFDDAALREEIRGMVWMMVPRAVPELVAAGGNLQEHDVPGLIKRRAEKLKYLLEQFLDKAPAPDAAA